MIIKIAQISLIIFFFFLPKKINSQNTELSSDFHKQRRAELRKKLPNNSVAVLFSSPIRNRANDVDYEYHPDPNFYYLTGWNEPHSVLLIYSNPQKDEKGTYHEKLYVRERDVRNEMWNGKRLGVEGALTMKYDRVVLKEYFLKDQHNFNKFDNVLIIDFKNDVRDGSDPSDLYDLQRHFKKKINYPDNFNALKYRLYKQIIKAKTDEIPKIKKMIEYYSQKDSLLTEDPLIKDFISNSTEKDVLIDLKTKSAFLIRNFNFDIDLLNYYMASLREIKTKDELILLKKAIQISAQGQKEVMKAIKPEMSEREVQGIHQLVYKKYGAAHEGYPSIVGAGDNACVLHYITNNKTDIKNQLILMDLGAEYNGYTADVTRTIPVSGVFTLEQRELYKIVYESQEAGISAAKKGASFKDVSNACYNVVTVSYTHLTLPTT